MKNEQRIFWAILIMVGVILGMLLIHMNVNASEPTTYKEYTVKHGDTLYHIAQENYPDAHTGRAVWQIQQDNNVDSNIKPGQILKLREVK